MPETRLPAVRIPSVRSEDGNGTDLEQDAIVVELPPSNKFAFAWPAETSTPVPHPLTSDRTTSLSSSEGETDFSEEELNAPLKRPAKDDGFEDADFVTPTGHLNVDQNPMDQAAQLPSLPRLSRAFSMPLPSQLGSLQNPRRMSISPDSPSPPPVQPLPDFGHFHELSLELADSVQMVIQTLLQLSPPQLLDPAKEQFSACSLSMPTPSVSALFTSMKNLNYMSANMSALSAHGGDSLNHPVSNVQNDFDIGEMLQSVGDTMSGMAAQAGVDLVLFHGDVGMKHVAVKGDESGISYTLSHILRQVIGTARRGDSVEVGLFIDPPNGDLDEDRSITSDGDSGPLCCIFHIAHRHAPVDADESSSERPPPSFSSLILRRLLRHISASFEVDSQPKWSSFVGHAYEVRVILDPGDLDVVNPTTSLTPEASASHPDLQVAQEPTLRELAQFAESLRGRKVTLHASSKGSFAHHLSSYLTAWGMDVSHVSTEPDADDTSARTESAESGDGLAPLPGLSEQAPGLSPVGTTRTNVDPLSFVLIDDDVQVLRNCLLKAKSEQAYPLSLNARKRPSLATNHRPRSSPQVVRVMGLAPNNSPTSAQIVIVHFTSLSKFKLVKDAIQSILTPFNGTAIRIPEVIVIPKPAGPRRFLTALHTAVTKPIVDPFFIPIATSPSSPGLHAFSPFFGMTTAPKSPGSRSTGNMRTASDRSNRSPKEHPGDGSNVGSSSPLGGSDRMEYFSEAAIRLGTSPSTGLVIQSPDGSPAGIFFHPKGKPWSTSPSAERDRPQQAGRQRGTSFLLPPGSDDAPTSKPTASSRSRNRSQVSSPDEETKSKISSKGKSPQPPPSISNDLPSLSSDQSVASSEPSIQPGSSRYVSRKSSQANSPPSSPQLRTLSMRRAPRRPGSDAFSSSAQSKKSKNAGDTNIVPPISVLIVDDNPINQTILSTFMKKKKIKYDVAKNGEEAVNKWRTGVFHLILMDIQMPVMDGIQATKEIRRIEKLNGAGGFPSTPQSEGQRTPSEASTSDSRSSSTPPYRSSVIIVALTASSLQADRVAALAAGCNDFLTKPVALEWLNSKIIEWGSIKALQMWADIRPDVVRSIASGQEAQAQNVARRLHVPEGRSTPMGPRSRSSSLSRQAAATETVKAAKRTTLTEQSMSPDAPSSDDSPGTETQSSGTEVNTSMPFPPVPVPLDNAVQVTITAPTPAHSFSATPKLDSSREDSDTVTPDSSHVAAKSAQFVHAPHSLSQSADSHTEPAADGGQGPPPPQ